MDLAGDLSGCGMLGDGSSARTARGAQRLWLTVLEGLIWLPSAKRLGSYCGRPLDAVGFHYGDAVA